MLKIMLDFTPSYSRKCPQGESKVKDNPYSHFDRWQVFDDFLTLSQRSFLCPLTNADILGQATSRRLIKPVYLKIREQLAHKRQALDVEKTRQDRKTGVSSLGYQPVKYRNPTCVAGTLNRFNLIRPVATVIRRQRLGSSFYRISSVNPLTAWDRNLLNHQSLGKLMSDKVYKIPYGAKTILKRKVPSKKSMKQLLRKFDSPTERKFYFVWLKYLHKNHHPFTLIPQWHVGKFRGDFLVPEMKTIIEVDGGYHLWNQSRDRWRQNLIEKQGYKVIRITNDEFNDNPEEAIKDMVQRLGSAYL